MQRSLPDFSYEQTYWNQDYVVIGLDEVGRGCLAGPVTVGGVCMQLNSTDTEKLMKVGINDSKKLSAKKREQISSVLKNNCDFYTASSSVEDINNLGIVDSIKKAMSTIVLHFKKKLPDKKIILLIDGLPIQHIPYIDDIKRVSIIKGDGACISIAAASILAKVERDLYMNSIDNEYPAYEWKHNKGYGTLTHRNTIQTIGISPYHRTLFVRNSLQQRY